MQLKKLITTIKKPKLIAITLLASTVSSFLIFSLFPKTDIGDLSTLALVAIAVIALDHSKQQSMEWRIKESIELAKEASEIHNKTYSENLNIVELARAMHEEEIRSSIDLTSYRPQDISSFINNNYSLISKLSLLELHLKKSNKASIQEIIDLLIEITFVAGKIQFRTQTTDSDHILKANTKKVLEMNEKCINEIKNLKIEGASHSNCYALHSIHSLESYIRQ